MVQRQLWSLGWVAACAIVAGCGDSVDAPTDAAPNDGGALDGTTADSGSGDEPVDDAGADAASDAGNEDGGADPDASDPDAAGDTGHDGGNDADGSGAGGDQPSADAVALGALRDASDAPVRLRVDGGIPRVVSLDVPVPSRVDDDVVRAFTFLDAHAALYRIPSPRETLIPERIDADPESGLSSVRLQQHIAGVPVQSSHLALAFDDQGHLRVTHGSWIPDLRPDTIDIVPRVGTEALGATADSPAPEQIAPPRLVILDPRLVPNRASTPRLAWRVVQERAGATVEAFYDAHDGVELATFDLARTIDSSTVCENPSSAIAATCAPERTWWIDGVSTGLLDAGDDPLGDGFAVNRALTFGVGELSALVALSGNGDLLAGPFTGQVYVNFVDAGGDPAPNAVARPDLRALAFFPEWTAIDVIGHEYGHLLLGALNVLEYRGESGALNESFADLTGNLVEYLAAEPGGLPGTTFSWYVQATSTLVLRDMANPPAGGQPDHVFGPFSGDEMGLRDTSSPEDNGWVHTNSGIPNKVFHLLSAGGTHNFWRVAPRGPRFTFRTVYRTLMTLGGPTTDLDDMGALMVAYAEAAVEYAEATGTVELSGWNPAVLCDVHAAWASVGIGVATAEWACPSRWEALTDDDNDGVEAFADNCRWAINPAQEDLDGDGMGDPCDNDDDNDGVVDPNDNCPVVSNPAQTNTDPGSETFPGTGDACDLDDDGDGVADVDDNCPLIHNSTQADLDGDDVGDPCDNDDDGDLLPDGVDNCPTDANANQWNNDGDALGNVCDPDDDNDTVGDAADNCPFTPGADVDPDGDGVGQFCDNCPTASNPGQEDLDRDGVGRACEGAVMDDPVTREAWTRSEPLNLEGSRDQWVELPANCPGCPVETDRGWGVFEPADLLVTVDRGARAELWTRSGTLIGVVDGNMGAGRLTVLVPHAASFRAPGAADYVATDALMLRLQGAADTIGATLSWE